MSTSVIHIDSQGKRHEFTLQQAIKYLTVRIVGYNSRSAMARLADSWKNRPIKFADGGSLWLLED